MRLKKINNKLKLHNDILKAELTSQHPDLVFSGDPTELFEIGVDVGRGSHGIVYKAKYKRTRSVVAIKIIRREVKELVNEIETLTELTHQNVVQYFACYVCNDETWIVMEYCQKGCVAERILQNSEIEITEIHVAAILKQVLHGIEYMHDHKKIHRDIKGANLLISREGIIKVADFSIAGKLAEGKKTQQWSEHLVGWHQKSLKKKAMMNL